MHFSSLYNDRILIVFHRHVQKVKASHHTKARNDVLASTSVPNVKENGCQETAGQIWDRSASSAMSMSTHINR